MQLLDDPFWGHANGRHEEFRSTLDDDVDQLAEITFGVVILNNRSDTAQMKTAQTAHICNVIR
jgi:hypothetical protein